MTLVLLFLNYLEFYEVELSEESKFMVLATDGVWEFISNEEVFFCSLTKF